jgi:AraC-like DNA-binding protein
MPPETHNCTVFESPLVRIGAFRCHPGHPAFHDSGPARHYCFVFPRTAVEIQHEHERAFVANPNVVTFYNRGQQYRRNAVSATGDRCDWFGVDADVVRDVVRGVDRSVDDRPERPFPFTHGLSDARSYLLQRQLFERVTADAPAEPFGIEEMVVHLLERVVRPASNSPQCPAPGQRGAIHHVETILSSRWQDDLHLSAIAREVRMSVYHLCRTFRRATGRTMHQYRCQLRLRSCLETLRESDRGLVDIALEAGFANHSHFTAAFRQEFGQTPSAFRGAANPGRSLKSLPHNSARFW